MLVLTKLASYLANLCDIMANAPQSSDARYFEILLIGRTGLGKSTTGNKLINASSPQAISFIRQWSSNIRGLLLSTQETSNGVSPSFKERNEANMSKESITKDCQLLSNDQNKIRVLDVPSFANSNAVTHQGVYKANLALFKSILHIQVDKNMPFDRVAYFLPTRGPLETVDGTLQEEIKVMYHYYGAAIFERMVLVATNHPQRQENGFTDEDKYETRRTFQRAYELTTENTLPTTITSNNGPPIIYIALEDEGATIDRKLREAHVNSSGLNCEFVDKVCTKCTLTMRFLEPGDDDRDLVGVRNSSERTLNDYSDSKCHPVFVSRYSILKKLLGGLFHVATLGIPYIAGIGTWPGFVNADKICPACYKSPGTPGCRRVKTEWEGNEGIVAVDHTTTEIVIS